MSIDPEERAQLERARLEAQEALQRAKLIVERSRLLLWSQDAGLVAEGRSLAAEPPASHEVAKGAATDHPGTPLLPPEPA